MNLLQQYKEYYSDNPNGYWFKRKLYGWGWTPVKWQGWALVLLYVLLILFVALSLGKNPTESDVIWFLVKIIILVILLIYICYKKGEKPKWQWGREDLK